jgi:hypothetical protein
MTAETYFHPANISEFAYSCKSSNPLRFRTDMFEASKKGVLCRTSSVDTASHCTKRPFCAAFGATSRPPVPTKEYQSLPVYTSRRTPRMINTTGHALAKPNHQENPKLTRNRTTPRTMRTKPRK